MFWQLSGEFSKELHERNDCVCKILCCCCMVNNTHTNLWRGCTMLNDIGVLMIFFIEFRNSIGWCCAMQIVQCKLYNAKCAIQAISWVYLNPLFVEGLLFTINHYINNVKFILLSSKLIHQIGNIFFIVYHLNDLCCG